MTKKIIAITYANGAIWAIPLHSVADHRAKYYAKIDKDTTYQSEYDYVMTDRHEGIDWFQSNMNWDEIANVAYELEKPAPFDPSKEKYEDLYVDTVEE